MHHWKADKISNRHGYILFFFTHVKFLFIFIYNKIFEKKNFFFFEKFHKLVFGQKVKKFFHYPLCIIYRWKGIHFFYTS